MSKQHVIDLYPSSKGCDGMEKCPSCSRQVAEIAAMVPPGTATALPFHILIKWEDGTFSTLPIPDPRLN